MTFVIHASVEEAHWTLIRRGLWRIHRGTVNILPAIRDLSRDGEIKYDLAGVRNVRRLLPEESGFYQPVVLASG